MDLLGVCMSQLWLHTANYKHHRSAALPTPPCPTSPSQTLAAIRNIVKTSPNHPVSSTTYQLRFSPYLTQATFTYRVKSPSFHLQFLPTNCQRLKETLHERSPSTWRREIKTIAYGQTAPKKMSANPTRLETRTKTSRPNRTFIIPGMRILSQKQPPCSPAMPKIRYCLLG